MSIKYPAPGALALAACVAVWLGGFQPAHAQKQKHILFIMGDDIGWFNIGAYHQGINRAIDRLASVKYRFIDQPEGWPGPKVEINISILTNIKQDPFERTPS